MSRFAPPSTGFGAVLLWALLALLTVATAPVPPFQLNAMTFAIGGLAGLVWIAGTGRLAAAGAARLEVVAFGTLGLFGYHALYFSALRLAPPAEAGLIAYLWPLLIVLFSGLLPGERLRPGHVLGALLGLAGAALLVGAERLNVTGGALPGYGLALALRADLERLFGAVAPPWHGADRGGHPVLPGDGAAVAAGASGVRTTAWPAGALGWLARAGPGPWAGGRWPSSSGISA